MNKILDILAKPPVEIWIALVWMCIALAEPDKTIRTMFIILSTINFVGGILRLDIRKLKDKINEK